MNKNLNYLILAGILLVCTACLGKDHLPQPSSGDYQGKVIDAQTRVGIPGVQVKIGNDYQTETDRDGSFRFESVEPGTYRVHLERDWYHPEDYGSKYVGKETQLQFEMAPRELSGGILYNAYRDKANQHDLYYLDLTTRSVRPITTGAASDKSPVGYRNQQILFESEIDEGIYIYLLSPGGHREKLFDSAASHPSADALGEKIVFQSKEGSTWKIKLGAGNGQVLRTLADGINPVISPDGVMVAYVKSDVLYICDLQVGTLEKVAFSGKINHPCWYPKPGRRKLAVEAWLGNGQDHRIYMIDLDAGGQWIPVTYGDIPGENHRHPCWSDNGEMLFFAGNICFKSREDIYAIRETDALQRKEKAQWVMVSPGTGSKTNPYWTAMHW